MSSAIPVPACIDNKVNGIQNDQLIEAESVIKSEEIQAAVE